MRIALTGASGFIGFYTARLLHEKGHRVTALVRPTSRRDHIEPHVDRFVVGEQDNESLWPDLLKDAECVIHNSIDWPFGDDWSLDRHLQSNLAGSIKLLAASHPRQFVYISSIAVHHDMRPRWNGLIDEDHPLRPANEYGALKAAVEAHLWAAHFEHGQHTCALRPCAVYGIDPERSRSHGHALIEKIKRGEAITKAGGGKFVHIDDVAAAIVATIGNPDAAGKPCNLVDCYARWADWAKIACEEMGVDVPIDFSSPAQSKNMFTKDAAQSLGVKLDRGHEGIRQHVRGLIAVMEQSNNNNNNNNKKKSTSPQVHKSTSRR